MSSAAQRAHGSQQQSSAFTSPPPAIARELLNLDALSPNALQAAAAAATSGHATTPPPVAPPPGKATPWTPNGPNNTHVPYLRVKLHPMFADLLDPPSARKAREAAAGAPAWRPGGSSKKRPGTAAAAPGAGAPAAFSTPQRTGGAVLQQRVPASAPSALESITARARATSRQTAAAYASQLGQVTPTRRVVDTGALSGGGSPPVTATLGQSGSPSLPVAQQQRQQQQQPTYGAAPLGRSPTQAAAAAAAQRGPKVPVPQAAHSRAASPSTKSPAPMKTSPASPPPSRGRGRAADAKPLSYSEWAQSQQHQPQKQRQQQQPASRQAQSPAPGQTASPLRKAGITHHVLRSATTDGAVDTPTRPSSSRLAVPEDTHDPSFSGMLGPRVHQGQLAHAHRHSPAAETLAQLPRLRSPGRSSRGSSTGDAVTATTEVELHAEATAAGAAAGATAGTDDPACGKGAVIAATGLPAPGAGEGEGAHERGAGRAGGGGVTAAAVRGGGTGGADAGMGSGHLRSHSLYDPQPDVDQGAMEQHAAARSPARGVGAVRDLRRSFSGKDQHDGDDDDDFSHDMTDEHEYGGHGDEQEYGLEEPQGGTDDRDDYSMLDDDLVRHASVCGGAAHSPRPSANGFHPAAHKPQRGPSGPGLPRSASARTTSGSPPTRHPHHSRDSHIGGPPGPPSPPRHPPGRRLRAQSDMGHGAVQDSRQQRKQLGQGRGRGQGRGQGQGQQLDGQYSTVHYGVAVQPGSPSDSHRRDLEGSPVSGRGAPGGVNRYRGGGSGSQAGSRPQSPAPDAFRTHPVSVQQQQQQQQAPPTNRQARTEGGPSRQLLGQDRGQQQAPGPRSWAVEVDDGKGEADGWQDGRREAQKQETAHGKQLALQQGQQQRQQQEQEGEVRVRSYHLFAMPDWKSDDEAREVEEQRTVHGKQAKRPTLQQSQQQRQQQEQKEEVLVRSYHLSAMPDWKSDDEAQEAEQRTDHWKQGERIFLQKGQRQRQQQEQEGEVRVRSYHLFAMPDWKSDDEEGRAEEQGTEHGKRFPVQQGPEQGEEEQQRRDGEQQEGRVRSYHLGAVLDWESEGEERGQPGIALVPLSPVLPSAAAAAAGAPKRTAPWAPPVAATTAAAHIPSTAPPAPSSKPPLPPATRSHSPGRVAPPAASDAPVGSTPPAVTAGPIAALHFNRGLQPFASAPLPATAQPHRLRRRSSTSGSPASPEPTTSPAPPIPAAPTATTATPPSDQTPDSHTLPNPMGLRPSHSARLRAEMHALRAPGLRASALLGGARGSSSLLLRASHNALRASGLLPAGLVRRGSHGGGLRASIGAASDFSALSGPQADGLYEYPSHGYRDRPVGAGSGAGLWEAAVLDELDLYDSVQALPYFEERHVYEDPLYSALPEPRPRQQPAVEQSVVGTRVGEGDQQQQQEHHHHQQQHTHPGVHMRTMAAAAFAAAAAAAGEKQAAAPGQGNEAAEGVEGVRDDASSGPNLQPSFLVSAVQQTKPGMAVAASSDPIAELLAQLTGSPGPQHPRTGAAAAPGHQQQHQQHHHHHQQPQRQHQQHQQQRQHNGVEGRVARTATGEPEPEPQPQPVATSVVAKGDLVSPPRNPAALIKDTGISNSTGTPAAQQHTASPMLPMPPVPLLPGGSPTPAPNATTTGPPSRPQPSPPQQHPHPHPHQLSSQHTPAEPAPPQHRRQALGGPQHPFDPIPEELTPHPLVLSPASLLSPASSTTGGCTAATTGTAGSSSRRAGTSAFSPLLVPRSSSAHTNPLFHQPGVPDASAVPPAMAPFSPRATSSQFTSPPAFTSTTEGSKRTTAAYGVQPQGSAGTAAFHDSPPATLYDTGQPAHVRQPRFGSPYRVPSVQAVQQLLESDLPTHAIAAAVAALAGALPPLPWDAPPPALLPPLLQGAASVLGNAPAVGDASTLTGSEAIAPGRTTSPGPPGSKAWADAAVVGTRAGVGSGTAGREAAAGPAAAAGVPRVLTHRHARGSAATLGSHVLVGLAGGEQGMPPKQLQEELEAVAAGEAAGVGRAVAAGEVGKAEGAQEPETEADGGQREAGPGREGGLGEEGGQAVDGRTVAGQGMEGAGASLSVRGRGSTLRGSGYGTQASSGPLARAARILAHSALVVLAGAAGAAAAAGSVTGVLLGPEDLPGDPHGTSIRYGRPGPRRRWWHKNAAPVHQLFR